VEIVIVTLKDLIALHSLLFK